MIRTNFYKIITAVLPGAVILLFVILLYSPAINYGFVSFDDDQLVRESQKPLTDWENLKRIFERPVFETDSNYYRPLLSLSFMADAASAKLYPWVYHRTNILLHTLAAILLFWFLGYYSSQKRMAFIFSLWFAVHPLFVSNVVWIPGRNDTLLAIFTLPLFVFLLKFLRSGRSVYLWLQLLFFILSLFTKETALVFPLLAIVIYFLEKPSQLSGREKTGIILIWAAAILFWLIARGLSLSNHMLLMYAVANFTKALGSNAVSLIVYLGKTLFPFNLSVFPIAKGSSLYPGIFAGAGLICLLWFSRQKRKPMVILGGLWFLLLLLPVLLVHNMELNWGEDMQLENRMYLPLVGIIILLMEAAPVKKLAVSKTIPLTVTTLVLLLYASIASNYSGQYRNSLIFWQNAVNSSPGSSVAHQMLAGVHLQEKKLAQAQKEFERAIELNPRKSGNFAGLGIIAMEKEEFPIAEKRFIQELNIDPQSAETYFNLGRLYYTQGRLKPSIRAFEKSLDLNRDLTESYGYLGVIYFTLNDFPKARYYVNAAGRKGMRIQPTVVEFLKQKTS